MTKLRRAHVVGLFTVGVPFFCVCASARAAGPTVDECLKANEAAVEAGNEHKLRTRLAQLLICASSTCPTDIREECSRRVDEVNFQMPTIVFEVKDAVGNDLSAVVVSMDGVRLADRTDGTALAVDPGDHLFLFEAVGQASVVKRLVIGESAKGRREPIVFEPLLQHNPPQHEPPQHDPPQHDPPQHDSPQHEPTRKSETSHKTHTALTIAFASAGVAGLALGSTFGLIAISRKHDAEQQCPSKCIDDEGVNAWEHAASAGNISTIAFIVGGAAITTAGILWLSRPNAHAQIGFGPSGVTLKAVW